MDWGLGSGCSSWVSVLPLGDIGDIVPLGGTIPPGCTAAAVLVWGVVLGALVCGEQLAGVKVISSSSSQRLCENSCVADMNP